LIIFRAACQDLEEGTSANGEFELIDGVLSYLYNDGILFGVDNN